MGGKLLEVDGTSIKFICEVRKQSTSSVHLSNTSNEYVAFKVKTTAPKRFCVRPNSGIISPKSACDFTVTMQGLRSAPSDVDCKDKFLIQSTVVDSGTREEDVTVDLVSISFFSQKFFDSHHHIWQFSKGSGKYVEEKKLKVVLLSKQDSPVKEHKNKVLDKEPFKQDSPVKEHKNKVLDKEPFKQDSQVKEHKNKVLDKEPSNEASIKEETVVKRDENVSPVHTKIVDVGEVESAVTKEELKPSGDLDGNERTLPKHPKFNPVKVVKEDPEKKLRLCNQLKELKLKEVTLENQLKEAKSTISSLTYQNSIVIEAKEILQLELDRRSKKGFPFAVVCIVSLVGLVCGYFSDP